MHRLILLSLLTVVLIYDNIFIAAEPVPIPEDETTHAATDSPPEYENAKETDDVPVAEKLANENPDVPDAPIDLPLPSSGVLTVFMYDMYSDFAIIVFLFVMVFCYAIVKKIKECKNKRMEKSENHQQSYDGSFDEDAVNAHFRRHVSLNYNFRMKALNRANNATAVTIPAGFSICGPVHIFRVGTPSSSNAAREGDPPPSYQNATAEEETVL